MSDHARAFTVEVHTRSEAETRHFAARLARFLQPGDLLAIEGELGAGKTCFVRGLAEGLDLEPSQVSSPTFVIAHEYASASGKAALAHIDAYRITGEADLETIGFSEMLRTGDAIIAIEWPSRIASSLPDDRIDVRLDAVGDRGSERLIRLSAPASHAQRLGRINAKTSDARDARKTHCRTCGKSIEPGVRTHPFCSDRCRMADLGGWFAGGYKMSRPMQADEEFSD